VALVAACATPAPDTSPPSAPAAVPAPAPAPGPPAPEPHASPATPVDPIPAAASATLEPLPPPAEDLWVRIRKGFDIPAVEGPQVAKWEEWYAARPEYVARMIDRSRRYLYYIVVQVEKRDMPLEIALLPMVESAFNPQAVSVSRASGIWQFMPSTGNLYGMKQTFWMDSRRDVVAATEGALNYLQKLHDQFDDWQLALAAYNWGEGNVARAIAKNEKAGRPTDYASLQMPDETRNYLPKLQAVKNIVSDPDRFGIDLGDIPDAPYFAVVKTSKQMDVKRAAELAEMSVEEFMYLNPHHNRPVIAGADEYTILLPIDKAELFAAKLDLIDQPLVSWRAYRMRPGETLPQIATKFNMPVESLRAVNGIGPRSRVPPGHTLLVPAEHPTDADADALARAVFTTVPQGRTFYYHVKRGDTIAGVADRYGVSAREIKGWNGLSQDAVKPGQTLRITSDYAPNAAKSKRAAGKRIVASHAKPRPSVPKPAAAKPAAAKPVSSAKPKPAGPRTAASAPPHGG
jgi:membrane-bound lytic murein transglycosylase D